MQSHTCPRAVELRCMLLVTQRRGQHHHLALKKGWQNTASTANGAPAACGHAGALPAKNIIQTQRHLAIITFTVNHRGRKGGLGVDADGLPRG